MVLAEERNREDGDGTTSYTLKNLAKNTPYYREARLHKTPWKNLIL